MSRRLWAVSISSLMGSLAKLQWNCALVRNWYASHGANSIIQKQLTPRFGSAVNPIRAMNQSALFTVNRSNWLLHVECLYWKLQNYKIQFLKVGWPMANVLQYSKYSIVLLINSNLFEYNKTLIELTLKLYFS